MSTETGLLFYDIVKDQRIAQAELTGNREKRLEDIRSAASINDFRKRSRYPDHHSGIIAVRESHEKV